MKKKVVCLILAIVMCLGLAMPVFAGGGEEWVVPQIWNMGPDLWEAEGWEETPTIRFSNVTSHERLGVIEGFQGRVYHHLEGGHRINALRSRYEVLDSYIAQTGNRQFNGTFFKAQANAPVVINYDSVGHVDWWGNEAGIVASNLTWAGYIVEDYELVTGYWGNIFQETTVRRIESDSFEYISGFMPADPYGERVNIGELVTFSQFATKNFGFHIVESGSITISMPGVYLFRFITFAHWENYCCSSGNMYVILEVTGEAAEYVPDGLAGASRWAWEGIDRAVNLGLVPAELQEKYTQPATRAEFAALAVALYETATGTTISGRVEFTDTDDVNVQKMAYLEVVTGLGDGRFNPTGQITREQAAVLLSRLAAAIGQPFPASAPTFADNANLSNWAVDGVGRAQAAGIMGGVGDNRFAPQDPFTREQSIVTILRMFDILD